MNVSNLKGIYSMSPTAITRKSFDLNEQHIMPKPSRSGPSGNAEWLVCCDYH